MSNSPHTHDASTSQRLAVVSLAGDPALCQDGDDDPREQQRAAQRAAKAIATLIREGFRVVVIPGGHGQLECELIRNEEASTKIAPITLAEAAAATQATVGARLEAALRNTLRQEELPRPIANLVTQILVAADDPAFTTPTRTVGPILTAWRARELARARRAHVVEEAGKGWRHVAATPVPVECLGLGAVEALLNSEHIVLTAAGGGVAVAVDNRGQLTDTDGLVDEAQVAALIANELAADLLVLMSPTESVSAYAGQVNQVQLEQPTRHTLRDLHEAEAFTDAALVARVDATLDFLDAGGEWVVLTVAQKLAASLAGRAGTRVTREAVSGEPTQQISLFASTGAEDDDSADQQPTQGGPS